MHGYMALDKNGELLVLPHLAQHHHRTGRQDFNGAFQFNIPQRWSIAHLYQAILTMRNMSRISAVLPPWRDTSTRLTGCQAIGVGEASGMFPIDSRTGTAIRQWQTPSTPWVAEKHYPWKYAILPQISTPAGPPNPHPRSLNFGLAGLCPLAFLWLP